ncbi:MAG: hypothetical protein AAF745_12720 [Planctomycetota bacterium]
MLVPEFAEATVWTRMLVAAITFVVLAGIAAAGIVVAMMMVLFSADGGETHNFNEAMFYRAGWSVVVSLAVAIVVPPLMLVFKASPLQSLVPAGLGFLMAGILTLWFVIVNLGG